MGQRAPKDFKFSYLSYSVIYAEKQETRALRVLRTGRGFVR